MSTAEQRTHAHTSSSDSAEDDSPSGARPTLASGGQLPRLKAAYAASSSVTAADKTIGTNRLRSTLDDGAVRAWRRYRAALRWRVHAASSYSGIGRGVSPKAEPELSSPARSGRAGAAPSAAAGSAKRRPPAARRDRCSARRGRGMGGSARDGAACRDCTTPGARPDNIGTPAALSLSPRQGEAARRFAAPKGFVTSKHFRRRQPVPAGRHLLKNEDHAPSVQKVSTKFLTFLFLSSSPCLAHRVFTTHSTYLVAGPSLRDASESRNYNGTQPATHFIDLASSPSRRRTSCAASVAHVTPFAQEGALLQRRAPQARLLAYCLRVAALACEDEGSWACAAAYTRAARACAPQLQLSAQAVSLVMPDNPSQARRLSSTVREVKGIAKIPFERALLEALLRYTLTCRAIRRCLACS